ncbi:hypothetical protein IE077_004387 [Cardiosporidium cionae]|uniref:Uncharacterized protein n=1 Tax=Cardiosporidium cionae TaxID=476202 RepID=A0ABQ7JAN5_9APIC|nr:hypothetical protein IE077_004387 [Cardiosporidium cionae]|eukprot:KAF8821067.1 hypothetical protein IE077_004387 [Cardiosporidium cionae]
MIPPWQPNKWKWYHRHGYWATRKKLLKFDKYRPYRYHEVKGLGPPKPKWWQTKSYHRPLRGKYLQYYTAFLKWNNRHKPLVLG